MSPTTRGESLPVRVVIEHVGEDSAIPVFEILHAVVHLAQPAPQVARRWRRCGAVLVRGLLVGVKRFRFVDVTLTR